MHKGKSGFSATLKSFPRSFWVANTMEIFERMAWYGFFSVSALYITGSVETGGLGFSSELRGNLQGIVTFFLYLMPVLTGALADRYGYKKTFILAFIIMTFSYYLLGQFKSPFSFFCAFMFVAVGAAVFKPVVVGTVGRLTTQENSSMGFGIFYMMVNIGGFAGPLVAGALRGLDWKWVFILSSSWACVNLILVLLFYKEPTTEATSASRRTLKKVLDDTAEVLGNLRFFIAVFLVLIALMVAGLGWIRWLTCGIFIVAWVLFNFLWDAFLPRVSGRPLPPLPVPEGTPKRNPFLQRMHCSNWRFALYLLILSGFWTSFLQLFITMPEYIRDYTDTKPMVDAARKVFAAIGKEDWIDRLASIEEEELLQHFDFLIRKTRGMFPIVPLEEESDDREGSSEKRQEQESNSPGIIKKLAADPGLAEEECKSLVKLAADLTGPGSASPLTAEDLAKASRRWLGYKVRLTPIAIGNLLLKFRKTQGEIREAQADQAYRTFNKKLAVLNIPPFEEEESQKVRTVLCDLVRTHGPIVPREEAERACKVLSSEVRAVDPKALEAGINRLAYRDRIWKELDGARQVNPEHIINIDALCIIIFQVLISFLMARFHRFTAMIVGMAVAAAGIGLPAIAGGTMIGIAGGSLFVVILGIFLFSIGEMMASPTSQEYVGRIAPRDKVALYMGYYFVSMALGNLFGGILSGQMYEKLAKGLQRPDLMWAGFGGLMLVSALIFLLYNKFALPKGEAPGISRE